MRWMMTLAAEGDSDGSMLFICGVVWLRYLFIKFNGRAMDSRQVVAAPLQFEATALAGMMDANGRGDRSRMTRPKAPADFHKTESGASSRYWLALSAANQ